MNQAWHSAYMMARCMIRVQRSQGRQIACDIERLRTMYETYDREIISMAEQIFKEKTGGEHETAALR